MDEEAEKQKIRKVIDTWMRASAEGNVDRVLSLMAEDVVFLLLGQEPMRGREAFAAASRAAIGKVRFEGRPEIQEIQIAGNFAFCWNYLSLKITPLPEGTPRQRSGHILSVFRREPDGRWVLYRDANLLTAVQSNESEIDKLAETHRRIGVVLARDWAPIGVGEAAVLSEYAGYVRSAYDVAVKTGSSDAVARYLLEIEQDSMGLPARSIDEVLIAGEEIVHIVSELGEAGV